MNFKKTLVFFIIIIFKISGYSAEPSIILNTIKNIKNKTLIGTARSLKNNQIVYYEYHNLQINNEGVVTSIETAYKTAQGNVFAELKSNMNKNETVPETKFHDFRFDKKEDLRVENNYAIFEHRVKDNLVKSKKYEIKKSMLAAQGFNNFIYLNFDKLLKEKLDIQFGVLSELDFFSFVASGRLLNDNTVVFTISISNRFLKMFIDDLEIKYDNKTKQLISYKGLSNIVDEENKKQEVLITYE